MISVIIQGKGVAISTIQWKMTTVKSYRSNPSTYAGGLERYFCNVSEISCKFSYCISYTSVVYSTSRIQLHLKVGEIMSYNFDFSYLKNGSPIVTLSAFGIAFNKGAIESLGVPDQVIIGYDQEQHAIGIRARGKDTTLPYYDFAPRVKNDWIRIGAKDFMKYLSRVSQIDFLTKAKQFVAEYDEDSQTLVVVVDEDHLK